MCVFLHRVDRRLAIPPAGKMRLEYSSLDFVVGNVMIVDPSVSDLGYSLPFLESAAAYLNVVSE